MLIEISGIMKMSGMSRQTDIKCHIFSEPQACVDFNDDENFRNDRNSRILGISGILSMIGKSGQTDIKCCTFLESKGRSKLNDVGNDRYVGNIRNLEHVRNIINIRIKCHAFLEI